MLIFVNREAVLGETTQYADADEVFILAQMEDISAYFDALEDLSPHDTRGRKGSNRDRSAREAQETFLNQNSEFGALRSPEFTARVG